MSSVASAPGPTSASSPPSITLNDISSFPLFLVQLTRFKCGGVSLSFSNEHHLSDGMSSHHFVNTWSEMVRGLITSATVPPYLDRHVLAARDPPRPVFPHVEHNPPPTLKHPLNVSGETEFLTFRLFPDQINAIKKECEDEKIEYSTYQVLTGHAWRCASIARGLPEDQETKLLFVLDGRRRLQTPLPEGYLGNVIFHHTVSAMCGQLGSNPLRFAVGKVKEAIDRVNNDEYLRSALDYLEVHLRIGKEVLYSKKNVNCPNFRGTVLLAIFKTKGLFCLRSRCIKSI